MPEVTDVEMMQDPYKWPGMLLPVKRYVNTQLKTAYLVDATPTLYHGNIFMPSPTDRKEKFASHEAIVAAGWRVD